MASGSDHQLSIFGANFNVEAYSKYRLFLSYYVAIGSRRAGDAANALKAFEGVILCAKYIMEDGAYGGSFRDLSKRDRRLVRKMNRKAVAAQEISHRDSC